jgi:hypothetical protein
MKRQTAPATPCGSLASKACHEAVDGGTTRIVLAFDPGGGPWLEPMARRLARLPRLTAVNCCDPSGPELEQLLATAAARQPSAVAGVQTLELDCSTSGAGEGGVFGPGLPALLRSLAHLPSLQVGPVADTRGWACSWCFACVRDQPASPMCFRLGDRWGKGEALWPS